jgi:ferredoxin
VVVNLAKLKSHAMMYLTLGVKNMFGAIVGLRKPEWHMRAGVDRVMFARLLVQIHQAVAPAFTIVDGIRALEGQGPGKSGRPRDLGMLVAGANTHAVDKTVCTLLGLDPNELLTYDLARRQGHFDGAVHVNGDIHIVDDFLFPELHSLSLGPESLNRFMRRYVIQKPVVDKDKCKLCGECWKICPADVISHDIKSIHFTYEKCIRCYCCLEVCSEGAIEAKEPVLGRLRRRMIGESSQTDETKGR